jgi:hypothetical protein
VPYQPQIPANLHLVTNPAEGPQFEHDCDHCNFLGRFVDDSGQAADLYFHGAIQQTTLARYSSEPSNYGSGDSISYGRSRAHTEARRRALRLGLCEYNVYEALECYVPGSDAEQELRESLPLTQEVEAFLLMQQGNLDESLSVLRKLVRARREKRDEFVIRHGGPSSAQLVSEAYVRMVSMYTGRPLPRFLSCSEISVAHDDLFTALEDAEFAERPPSSFEPL